MRSLRSPWRRGPFCGTKRAEESFDTVILDKLVSQLPDMSFEAQFARIHAAANNMDKFTLYELMTKANARKGAVLRYCTQFGKAIGTVQSPYSNRVVSLYTKKEAA